MCGEGNSYNHPEDEAVARIAKYADKKNIYRTDLSGTVVVISDGEGIGIKTEK
jgi:beta-lactamase superfamily II metal-dependent hydrolase